MRDNMRQKKYQSRKDFLEDVHQIVQNSTIFNGMNSTEVLIHLTVLFVLKLITIYFFLTPLCFQTI